MVSSTSLHREKWSGVEHVFRKQMAWYRCWWICVFKFLFLYHDLQLGSGIIDSKVIQYYRIPSNEATVVSPMIIVVHDSCTSLWPLALRNFFSTVEPHYRGPSVWGSVTLPNSASPCWAHRKDTSRSLFAKPSWMPSRNGVQFERIRAAQKNRARRRAVLFPPYEIWYTFL